MFLSFLGCDGSGKSAVIAGVTERLEKQGVVVTRGHWPRDGFLGPQARLAVAELVGRVV